MKQERQNAKPGKHRFGLCEERVAGKELPGKIVLRIVR